MSRCWGDIKHKGVKVVVGGGDEIVSLCVGADGRVSM